jgi:hypothetical protein
MIRIAITQAAFEAIASTLPFGSVSYENQINEQGQRLIWLDPTVVNRLRALRGPGESYSDVILRLSADAPGRIVPRRRRVRSARGSTPSGHPPPME